MEVILESISKKFKNDWIFRDINLTFQSGTSYAITGPNGSGKSTLLMIIAGWMLPSAGRIRFVNKNKTILPENHFRNVSITAPYLDLIEEFTLEEMIRFHFSFKNLRDHISFEEFIKIIDLVPHKKKQIKNFSSGMKQRLRLGLGLFSDDLLLLLDEPATNLDEKAREWYLEQVTNIMKRKTVLIASNQHFEYKWCEKVIDIREFK